jgi:wyosine [tRNA(Phe)-imidazoG37] synthetase (radical SAM superfamily)
MIVYGPVPSRRLGRSIGINNIPPKNCSYSCIYCQVGITTKRISVRKEFYSTDDIVKQVEIKLNELYKKNENVDYLSFVPDGEPTLDINLGKTIRKLRQFGIKIAVITNSSLLWDEIVRSDLSFADWVSVKVDTVINKDWIKVNHPAKGLVLNDILQGIKNFRKDYSSVLVTETMLVSGINSNDDSLNETAKFISTLNAKNVYILVPIRPPAVKLEEANETIIKNALSIYFYYNNNVKLINYNEGNNFSSFSNPIDELLSILSVHPMRKDAITEYFKNARLDEGELNNLIKTKKIKEISYNNTQFYKTNNEV